MRYCAGFDTIVADSPVWPVTRSQAATVSASVARSRSPSWVSRYVVDCDCQDRPATPAAYCSVPAGVGGAENDANWSVESFSNRHHAFRPRLAGTHVPVPTKYSTRLVAEFPARSVAVTVNPCQPGVVVSGVEPSEMAQLATPEYPAGSLQEKIGVTVVPAL